MSAEKTKGRFENIVWPQYDANRKYLLIATKPKIREHYHSHRLSFWHHLFPQLQSTDDNDLIYVKHHLLVDYENPSSYDGVVRHISLKMPATVTSLHHHATATVSTTSNHFDLATYNLTSSDTHALVQSQKYTTLTIITVGVGTTLLVINIIVFIAVYYKLERSKRGDQMHDTYLTQMTSFEQQISAKHVHYNGCPSDGMMQRHTHGHVALDNSSYNLLKVPVDANEDFVVAPFC